MLTAHFNSSPDIWHRKNMDKRSFLSNYANEKDDDLFSLHSSRKLPPSPLERLDCWTQEPYYFILFFLGHSQMTTDGFKLAAWPKKGRGIYSDSLHFLHNPSLTYQPIQLSKPRLSTYYYSPPTLCRAQC